MHVSISFSVFTFWIVYKRLTFHSLKYSCHQIWSTCIGIKTTVYGMKVTGSSWNTFCIWKPNCMLDSGDRKKVILNTCGLNQWPLLLWVAALIPRMSSAKPRWNCILWKQRLVPILPANKQHALREGEWETGEGICRLRCKVRPCWCEKEVISTTLDEIVC